MPTYDYVCDACQHEWEAFHAMSADPIRKCPECGKNKARRVIGPGAGIIFKGSGFYQTDYRSNSYKKEAKADREAASKASESKSSDSSSKSDSSAKSDSGSKPASSASKSSD